MENFIAAASLFALDIFSESKMPCWLNNFTYFDRVLVACFAPLGLMMLIVLGGIWWARRHHVQRKRGRITTTRSTLMRERLRGVEHGKAIKSVLVMGLWKAAPIALFLLDLLYPTITRTLCSFFVCRDLGAAGKYLEVDYGPVDNCRVCIIDAGVQILIRTSRIYPTGTRGSAARAGRSARRARSRACTS